MSVDTVTVNNTGDSLGKLAFPSKETFKSKNNIASLDDTGKLVLSQAPYVAGNGIRISNTGVISATGGGSGGSTDEHNKGWFSSPDQLPETGEDGDYAIVGSTDTVWIWDSDTSKWVDSGAKGLVQTVNRISASEDGNVQLTAEDIKTTEGIVLVGDAGTSLEAAMATVARNTAENSKIVGNVQLKTQFINSATSSHTTTIDGILDVVDNEAYSADIRFKGESIITKYDAKQDQLKNYSETDRSSQIDAKANDSNGGYINLISEGGPTSGDFDITVGKSTDGDGGTLDILVEKASENKTASKLNITADEINITGSFKVNNSQLANQSDLTALQNKVANISTNDGTTIVTGTLEVVGTSDTDIPTVDTGDKGQVLTNTIVVSDEIDTAKIAMSGNKAVKIDSFDTSISASSTDTALPTSKAVITAISNSSANKADLNASNLSDENVTSWKEKLEINAIETALDAKQTKSNLVTTFSVSTSDEKYPSEKLVYTSLNQINQRVTGIENDTKALSTSKQDKLKAGNNIEIASDNTISVVGIQVSITSTVEITITPTVAQTATAIENALAKAARVIVTPKYTNTGAIYIKESDTYSSINPIYPDPANNVYEFTNMQNVRIFVDTLGDSVDLVIEYRG